MALLLGLLLGPAAASAAPEAAQVRQAAENFDAGLRALGAEQYEQAASYFEAADQAVPSEQALRGALQARYRAGHAARAATLAAQSQLRYPSSRKLAALAQEVLAAYADSLHRVEIHCTKECVLAVDARAVSGPPIEDTVVYVEPGRATTISASFVSGAGNDQQSVEGEAGGESSIRFEPPPEEEPTHEPAPTPTAKGTSPGPTPPPPPETSSGISPVVFFIALGATAVAGGITIWSGVDTLNNPGTEAVRESCQGLGTDCPEYQDGLGKELRTNVLIAVTGGTAALTLVLALLTDWSSSEPAEDARTAPFAVGPGGVQISF